MFPQGRVEMREAGGAAEGTLPRVHASGAHVLPRQNQSLAQRPRWFRLGRRRATSLRELGWFDSGNRSHPVTNLLTAPTTPHACRAFSG